MGRCQTSPVTSATASLDGVNAAPGEHVCAFYRGSAERRRILAQFLGEGIRAGAPCLCIAGAEDRAWLKESVGPEVATDAFERTYTAGGRFDRAHMLEYWRRWGAETGPGGRTASDMSWADFAGSALDEFMAYETEATAFARELSAISLCLYDLDRLGGAVIIPALRAHPAVLVSGVLVRNPYCAAPAA